jgi:aspartate--ammonia ligase
MALIIPEKYHSILDIHTTQLAIKDIKDFFQRQLAKQLNLARVTAPLFVHPDSGLNDRLNDVERPVSFDILETGEVVEIVHSLAKWKRYALKQYDFSMGEGLYTDMNAIRRDETSDNLHSLYVDQWDWEKIIEKSQRTTETLQDTVKKIYAAMVATEAMLTEKYPSLSPVLPKEIHFVTSQELEDAYPNLTGKERENAVCKKYGAVFISQIGGKLESGEIHDGRAPDYDDWSMNGDILVWYDLLGVALELSSMGVRVDEASLLSQLEQRGVPERANLPFQQAVLNGQVPYTIGGGIGQSRLCMFFLKKAHIGEVQVSQWPKTMLETCKEANIHLL